MSQGVVSDRSIFCAYIRVLVDVFSRLSVGRMAFSTFLCVRVRVEGIVFFFCA